MVLDARQRARGIGSFSHHLEGQLLLDELAEPFAEDGVVVHDHHSGLGADALRGAGRRIGPYRGHARCVTSWLLPSPRDRLRGDGFILHSVVARADSNIEITRPSRFFFPERFPPRALGKPLIDSPGWGS